MSGLKAVEGASPYSGIKSLYFAPASTSLLTQPALSRSGPRISAKLGRENHLAGSSRRLMTPQNLEGPETESGMHCGTLPAAITPALKSVGGICFPIFPERVRPVMEFHRGHIGDVGIGAARGMELVCPS